VPCLSKHLIPIFCTKVTLHVIFYMVAAAYLIHQHEPTGNTSAASSKGLAGLPTDSVEQLLQLKHHKTLLHPLFHWSRENNYFLNSMRRVLLLRIPLAKIWELQCAQNSNNYYFHANVFAWWKPASGCIQECQRVIMFLISTISSFVQ